MVDSPSEAFFFFVLAFEAIVLLLFVFFEMTIYAVFLPWRNVKITFHHITLQTKGRKWADTVFRPVLSVSTHRSETYDKEMMSLIKEITRCDTIGELITCTFMTVKTHTDSILRFSKDIDHWSQLMTIDQKWSKVSTISIHFLPLYIHIQCTCLLIYIYYITLINHNDHWKTTTTFSCVILLSRI